MMKWLMAAILVVGVSLSACGGGGGAANQGTLPSTGTSPVDPTPKPSLGKFSTARTVSLTYSDTVKGLTSNPLKGLVSFSEDAWAYDNVNGLPKSMEFFYISLRDLMAGENSFVWTKLDNELAAIASRGNQAVFRVFLDYPHRQTGIPQYLLDAGLMTFSYGDHGNVPTSDRPEVSVIPDYNDARLIAALLNFVTALGARYDGDPRIGFIEAGLYGFWGEWHVFPDAGSEPSQWVMKQAHKDRLLSAYANAFSKTRISVRFATATQDAALKTAFGYQDDSFAYWTLGPQNFHFAIQMQTAGLDKQWQKQAIGGEIRPEVSKSLWDSWPSSGANGAQPFEDCVRTTHASWIRHAYMFARKEVKDEKGFTITIEPSVEEIANAEKAIRLLGYTLHVPSVEYHPDGNGIHLHVDVENRGVAPFYYDWMIQLVFVDAGNKLVGSPIDTDWRLSEALPRVKKRFSHTIGAVPVAAQKLLLRVVNPLPNGHPLVFANQEQGRDLNGWLTLTVE